MPLEMGGRTEIVRGRVEENGEELIWVKSLDVVLCQHIRREVREVEGYYELSLPLDRGGENMPVIGVRKSQGIVSSP